MRIAQETLDELEREVGRALRRRRSALVWSAEDLLGLVRDHRELSHVAGWVAALPCLRGLGVDCEGQVDVCVPCKARRVVRLNVD